MRNWKTAAKMVGPLRSLPRKLSRPLHLQEQRAQPSPLVISKRDKCEKAGKVCGRLGHGYDIQINISGSVPTETADPAGIRNGPAAFASGIGSQASDDVVIESRLRPEIDKVEGLTSTKSPQAGSSPGEG